MKLIKAILAGVLASIITSIAYLVILGTILARRYPGSEIGFDLRSMTFLPRYFLPIFGSNRAGILVGISARLAKRVSLLRPAVVLMPNRDSDREAKQFIFSYWKEAATVVIDGSRWDVPVFEVRPNT